MGETVQKKLSKKDIIKSYLIWTFFSHSTYNDERMQASGVLHAIAPSLEKLYGKDTQELREDVYKRQIRKWILQTERFRRTRRYLY